MTELHDLTALEQWTQLQRTVISPSEIARHYLDRIARCNDTLGAFITVTDTEAMKRARALEISDTRTARLWGLPYGDKDLSARKGVRTTYGSRLLADYIPEVSDDIVTAFDDAGAVSLGKTNTPEFGLPSYTENLIGPPARNPYDLTLGAGGSSGGAAVAVAAGLLPFAPGSDGGGSIRIPAAACGLVGLKPSRGLVPSGTGIDKLGGLVVPGPLARTVADAALMLDAMIAGGDYPFTLRAPRWEGGDLLGAAIRGEGRFQLGVMTTTPWDLAYDIQICPESTAALQLAIHEFDALGHGVELLCLEPDESYSPAFRTIWQAGAASIPAEGEAVALLEPLTQWLVGQGRAISARDLAEALATLAGYERSIIAQFAGFDAILTPALTMTPRPLGWYDQKDAERNFAQQVQYTPFTSLVNVSGLPAITLPVMVTEHGLPMGVQLIGRPGGEHVLLSLGAQLERRLHWQDRHPPLW